MHTELDWKREFRGPEAERLFGGFESWKQTTKAERSNIWKQKPSGLKASCAKGTRKAREFQMLKAKMLRSISTVTKMLRSISTVTKIFCPRLRWLWNETWMVRKAFEVKKTFLVVLSHMTSQTHGRQRCEKWSEFKWNQEIICLAYIL